MPHIAGYGAKREMLSGTFSTNVDKPLSAPWYDLPQPDAKQKTAIIVGAGVAGLTTAWQLVQRGWSIKLVDKHAHIASEASGNPAAIFMPRLAVDDAIDNAFYVQAFCFARQQYVAFQQTTEQPFWFDTGVLNGFDKTRAERMLERTHITSVYSIHRCWIVPQ